MNASHLSPPSSPPSSSSAAAGDSLVSARGVENAQQQDSVARNNGVQLPWLTSDTLGDWTLLHHEPHHVMSEPAEVPSTDTVRQHEAAAARNHHTNTGGAAFVASHALPHTPSTPGQVFNSPTAIASNEMLYTLPSSSSPSSASSSSSSPAVTQFHTGSNTHHVLPPSPVYVSPASNAASLHPFYTLPMSSFEYVPTHPLPSGSWASSSMLPPSARVTQNNSMPPPPPSLANATAHKRLRVEEGHFGGAQFKHEKSPADTLSAPMRALDELATCMPADHPLRGVAAWSATQVHCFSMTPLKRTQRDYFNRSLTFRHFAVHLINPSQPIDEARRNLPLPPPVDEHNDHYTISRPRGRSLHLVVTVMPNFASLKHLSQGFAFIIVCRRTLGAWVPVSLASFNPAKHTSRNRSAEVTFHANLDHCQTEATGRRIWGQSTSHVRRRGDEAMKAVRLEPRGPIAAKQTEQYCFYVALFNGDGRVLQDDDGQLCIARTNIVRYEADEKPATVNAVPARAYGDEALDSHSALLEAMSKMTLIERASALSVATPWLDTQTKLLTMPDPKLLKRVGVQVFDVSDKVSATAVALSTYARLDTPEAIERGEIGDDFAARIRAVAQRIGWHHADLELYDPRIRTLESLNCTCAGERFRQIKDLGVADADAWLRKIGVGPEVSAGIIARRAEMAAYIMRDPKFRGSWMLCMSNPYPDRILVDRADPKKVHCLADTTHEADICLRDRMQILVRLTYCVKAQREQLDDLIFGPYVQGFQSRAAKYIIKSEAKQTTPSSTSSTSARLAANVYAESPIASYPVDGELVQHEKFELLLHAMHLDYFLYWTHFRNAPSVRRIYRRLLEEDRAFNPWYFMPGRFTPFEASSL